MECVEQCAAYEVLRPDHVRGPDQKPAAEAREAEASQGQGGSRTRAKMEAVVQIRDDDGVDQRMLGAWRRWPSCRSPHAP